MDPQRCEAQPDAGDLGGMLTWDKPHCDVFRQMIAHPRLMPYLEELLGPGPRLEGLGLITMNEGAEGFWFHEGGEPFDRSRGFLYRNGRMYCGMTNMARSTDRCRTRRRRFRLFARQPQSEFSMHRRYSALSRIPRSDYFNSRESG